MGTSAANGSATAVPLSVTALLGALCVSVSRRKLLTLCPSDFIALPAIYQRLFDDFGWVKLSLLLRLFDGVDCVRIVDVTLSEQLMMQIHAFLAPLQVRRRGAMSQPKTPSVTSISAKLRKASLFDRPRHIEPTQSAKSLSLRALELRNVDEQHLACHRAVERFQSMFNDLGWRLAAVDSGRGSVHSLFVKLISAS